MGLTLGERIKELSLKARLSQKELAERAGVTEAAISHYIKGDRSPRAEVLSRIASALGTTSDYLSQGIPVEKEGELQYAKRLIAKNVTQMTAAEKKEILEILLGGSNNETPR
jgi:transcriptional regulator with XRE-family HTH domain